MYFGEMQKTYGKLSHCNPSPPLTYGKFHMVFAFTLQDFPKNNIRFMHKNSDFVQTEGRLEIIDIKFI